MSCRVILYRNAFAFACLIKGYMIGFNGDVSG
jgi:hypothetical protein